MTPHEGMTGGAAVVAALAALWKWVGEKAFHIRSELPAIELCLNAQVLDTEGTHTLVRLCADWENKGTVALFVVPDLTEVTAFDISTVPEQAQGTGMLDEPGPRILTMKPLAGLRFFVMEPSAKGSIDCLASVPSMATVLFRLRLSVHLRGWRAIRFMRLLGRHKSSEQADPVRQLAWLRSAIIKPGGRGGNGAT